MYEFVLTERMLKYIRSRLGMMVVYTITGFCYWDQSTRCFKETEGYRRLHWDTMCLGAYTVPLWIFLYSSHKATYTDVPDTDLSSHTANSDLLVVLVSALFGTVLVMIFLVSRSVMQHSHTFVAALNLPPTLNSVLKQTFQIDVLSLPGLNARKMEQHTLLATWLTLIMPLFLVISFLHPIDPLHNMFEDVLEVKVGFNIQTIVFICLLAYTGMCILTTATFAISLFICLLCITNFWILISQPTRIRFEIANGHRYYVVETRGLGVQQEEVLVWLFRCQQRVVVEANEIFKTTKCAFHSTGILIVAVMASFSLIKFNSILFEADSPKVGLVFMLVAAFVLPCFVYYIECTYLQSLEAVSFEFRAKLLSLAPRNTALYKSARSLRLVKLHMGGEYFNTNRSTFMEWCDTGIANLANLLVTF